MFSFLKYVFTAISFRLGTAFFAYHKFWQVVFSFNSKYFKHFLKIYSLSPVFFKSGLFTLQVFWDFSFIFLLLISSLVSLWSESRHVLFPFFIFVKVRFTAQNVFYLGGCSKRSREECIFSCCWWSSWYMSIISSWFAARLSSTMFLLIFPLADSVYFWYRGVEVFNHNNRSISLSAVLSAFASRTLVFCC